MKRSFNYFFLISLIALSYLLFSDLALIAAWCCLGVLLSIFWDKYDRFLLLKVLVLQIIVALVFCLFVLTMDRSIHNLANNSQYSVAEWVGLVAGINVVTSILTISTFYHFARLVAKKLKRG